VVKSYPPAPIVGWRSDDVNIYRDLVLFRLVAPSLQPGESGSVPGMGCLVLYPFAAGGNQSYRELFGS
jgi:hypothetical protein